MTSRNEPSTDGRDIITAQLAGEHHLAYLLAFGNPPDQTQAMRATALLLAWIDGILAGWAAQLGRTKQDLWAEFCAQKEQQL